MQDPYLELKIDETRVEELFLKSIGKGPLNGREFKDYYHTSHRRRPNNFLMNKLPSKDILIPS